MKKCFGYIRVSTKGQNEGVSPEAQRDAITAFAERNDIVIVKWFSETVTAAKQGRPLFEKMVTQLKAGHVAGVVFHKIDRSARNIMDWARIGELHEAGVAIHFAHESFDFNSRGGRLAADIQAVVAADFIRNNRQESIKGQRGRLKQGLCPYTAPVGYLNTGKGKAKAIDPVKGPIVRELFELYASGNYSFKTLAQEANELGLTNIKGKRVIKSTIEEMICNPFYMGIIKIKRSGLVYDGVHEPLVSPKLFEQAQAVRTGRRRKITTVHNYQFRGLFDCGYCGRRMVGERQAGRVYYRCHQKGCPTKTVREDVLEAAVHANLRKVTLNDQQITTLRQKYHQHHTNTSEARLAKQAPLELAKLENRLSSLTNKFVDDLIDADTYNAKKTEILMETKRWKAAQKDHEAANSDHIERWLEKTKNLCSSYISFDWMQKRELLKFASSKRIAYGKNIEIEPPNWYRELKFLLDDWQCAQHTPSTRNESDVWENLLHYLNE